MEERIDIAAPDALWLAALTRDRARAQQRLADVLPGREVGEAAHVAARCVHSELDREARIAAAQRPRWIDRQVAALAAERAARPEHPGWAEYRRRAQATVGKGRVTAWDAAAGRAVALVLPVVVWGERGGQRPEPVARRHRLGIDGYDVARCMPVSGPVQLWADRPATVEDPEPEPVVAGDTEVPPDGVGVVDRG